MSETINLDGTPVLIEAVWYRHHSIYIKQYESVEDARRMLDGGEDYGELSSVGVFVEGKPRLWKYHDDEVLTEDRIRHMETAYAEAKALSERRDRLA